MKSLITLGVETLISTTTKIAKKDGPEGMRQIEPAGEQSDDKSKQPEARDSRTRRKGKHRKQS
jgi:hypothetical protein